MDLVLVEAIRKNDLEGMSKLLISWRTELDRHGLLAESPGSEHPFAAERGGVALPEDFLDVFPANFILSSGSPTLVDREWVAPSPVSGLLVEVRALWWFAHELVESGAPHPWGSLATVDETCQALCNLAGVTYRTDTLTLWRRAEADLLHLVNGGDIADHLSALEAMAVRRSVDVSPRMLPFTTLRAGLDAARRESEGIQQAASELREQVRERLDEKEAELLASRLEGDALRHGLVEADARAGALGEEVDRLKVEITKWSDRMGKIERRLPVRLYRLARRLTHHR